MKQGHHCPYLGLKHNRAIRFASPTQEHRCYVSGEPQEIPVDQARYCLSANHVRCPLYTGEMLASMVPITRRQSGLGGWIRNLSPRDRAIYGALVGLLGVILVIYGIGAYLLWAKSPDGLISGESATPTSGEELAGTEVVLADTPTPTATQTASPTPHTPTVIFVVVTATPDLTATRMAEFMETPAQLSPTPTASSASASPVSPTFVVVTATPEPTEIEPSATVTPRPTRATATAVAPLPTASEPAATETPIAATPTESPTSTLQATVTLAPGPLEPPGQTTSVVTLYFADSSGRLLVPVTRAIDPTNRWRTSAIRELLRGPGRGLSRLLPEDTELISLGVSGNVATVNLSKTPGSTAAIQSIVLTLTERTDVTRVQIQVNGSDLTDDPLFRPNVNSDNPQGLSGDFSSTEFLPLYFPLRDGSSYQVRVTRLVPKTPAVARETIQGLIDGPGQYDNLLGHPIPTDTEINSLKLDSNVLNVDLSAAFADADDRQAAVDSMLLSLTSFSSIQRVAISVDGRSLGELWGSEYGGPLERPALNPE